MDLSLDDYTTCKIPEARTAADLLLSNIVGAGEVADARRELILVTLIEDGCPVWGSVGDSTAIRGLLHWSREPSGAIAYTLSSDGAHRIQESLLNPTRELITRLGFGKRPEDELDRTEQIPVLAAQFAADDERAAYKAAFHELARRCKLRPQERAALINQFLPPIDQQ